MIYEVGGCVRDEILGLKSKDVDYTFVSKETDIDSAWNDLKSWLSIRGFTIFLETKNCFTIRARFPDSMNKGLTADFVLARKEKYNKNSRIPEVTPGTLEDDLFRRDFCCNAIAKDMQGNYIDPLNGMEDIKRKILRCPLHPVQTLTDDPLRIIRALRFSITKGFKIDFDLAIAITNPVCWEKFESVVSPERIREEIQRMFKHDTVQSLMLFSRLEESMPGVLNKVFRNDMWLMPTFKE